MLVLVIEALLYSSLLTMLSTGYTLTYLTAEVPNFAHVTMSIVGAYITFTLFLQGASGVHIYLYGIPLSFVTVGLLFFIIYKVVIRPLLSRGTTIVQLAVVTVAIEMILFGFINIYADFLTQTYKYFSRFFILREVDFSLAGLPGIFWVSVISCGVFVVAFHFILTRTKFGIGLRATVENSSLAAVLGVNVDQMRAISWFLTGSTCGVVGCLLPLWLQVYPTMGVTLIISVMAGSILGGLRSVYGAMIGGFIIGLTEMLGTSALMQIVGSWISAYKLLIPLGVMVVILMKAPDGISGLVERYRARRSKYG